MEPLRERDWGGILAHHLPQIEVGFPLETPKVSVIIDLSKGSREIFVPFFVCLSRALF